MAELICERLTGEPTEGYQSPAMRWGIDTEPLAISAYEAATGEMVEEVGFIDHPTIENFGCSPDGLVGAAGGTEIKCPNQATHLEFLLSDGIDGIETRYLYQIQTALACTKRLWWDYVSYNPRFPEELAYKCIRIPRNAMLINDIEREVKLFLEELEDKLSRLKGLKK